MQKIGKSLFTLCVVVLTFAFASTSFASADMYLEIKDSKGKVTKVKVNEDGSFSTGPLAKGVYSFSWGLSQGGSSKRVSFTNSDGEEATEVCVTYEVKSPRDAQTGQSSGKREAGSGIATGKRQHKPFKIVKSLDKSTPQMFTTVGSVTIDDDCDGLDGRITFRTKSKQEFGPTQANKKN